MRLTIQHQCIYAPSCASATHDTLQYHRTYLVLSDCFRQLFKLQNSELVQFAWSSVRKFGIVTHVN